jgi:hypothetical protein
MTSYVSGLLFRSVSFPSDIECTSTFIPKTTTTKNKKEGNRREISARKKHVDMPITSCFWYERRCADTGLVGFYTHSIALIADAFHYVGVFPLARYQHIDVHTKNNYYQKQERGQPTGNLSQKETWLVGFYTHSIALIADAFHYVGVFRCGVGDFVG